MSPNGGNRLQVSLKILCFYEDTGFHLNLTLLKPWVNRCIRLMETFSLSYVNATVCLLWNLPLFKTVPPKTNFFPFLKTWAVNSSTNQYSYPLFYGWGMTHLRPFYLKNASCGRGAWKLPQPWGVSLIDFLTDIKQLAKTGRGGNPCPLSDVYDRSFPCPFFTLTKLCYTKALEWSSLAPVSKAKSSSSEITNPTPFTVNY